MGSLSMTSVAVAVKPTPLPLPPPALIMAIITVLHRPRKAVRLITLPLMRAVMTATRVALRVAIIMALLMALVMALIMFLIMATSMPRLRNTRSSTEKQLLPWEEKMRPRLTLRMAVPVAMNTARMAVQLAMNTNTNMKAPLHLRKSA